MLDTIRLLHRQTDEIVVASVISDTSLSLLAKAESDWRLYRRNFHERRLSSESASWNWADKYASAPEGEFFAINLGGRIEGLMQVAVQPRISRLTQDAPGAILYVEHIEAAPWNQPAYVGADAEYKNIGVGLLWCAVERSMEKGLGGVVGLHSLPESEAFYRRLGFIDLGMDSAEGYRYFELSEDTAAKILQGGWR